MPAKTRILMHGKVQIKSILSISFFLVTLVAILGLTNNPLKVITINSYARYSANALINQRERAAAKGKGTQCSGAGCLAPEIIANRNNSANQTGVAAQIVNLYDQASSGNQQATQQLAKLNQGTAQQAQQNYQNVVNAEQQAVNIQKNACTSEGGTWYNNDCVEKGQLPPVTPKTNLVASDFSQVAESSANNEQIAGVRLSCQQTNVAGINCATPTGLEQFSLAVLKGTDPTAYQQALARYNKNNPTAQISPGISTTTATATNTGLSAYESRYATTNTSTQLTAYLQSNGGSCGGDSDCQSGYCGFAGGGKTGGHSLCQPNPGVAAVQQGQNIPQYAGCQKTGTNAQALTASCNYETYQTQKNIDALTFGYISTQQQLNAQYGNPYSQISQIHDVQSFLQVNQNFNNRIYNVQNIASAAKVGGEVLAIGAAPLVAVGGAEVLAGAAAAGVPVTTYVAVQSTVLLSSVPPTVAAIAGGTVLVATTLPFAVNQTVQCGKYGFESEQCQVANDQAFQAAVGLQQAQEAMAFENLAKNNVTEGANQVLTNTVDTAINSAGADAAISAPDVVAGGLAGKVTSAGTEVAAVTAPDAVAAPLVDAAAGAPQTAAEILSAPEAAAGIAPAPVENAVNSADDIAAALTDSRIATQQELDQLAALQKSVGNTASDVVSTTNTALTEEQIASIQQSFDNHLVQIENPVQIPGQTIAEQQAAATAAVDESLSSDLAGIATSNSKSATTLTAASQDVQTTFSNDANLAEDIAGSSGPIIPETAAVPEVAQAEPVAFGDIPAEDPPSLLSKAEDFIGAKVVNENGILPELKAEPAVEVPELTIETKEPIKITIGRNEQKDFFAGIGNKTVSRIHGELTLNTDGTIIYTDLDSTYGTTYRIGTEGDFIPVPKEGIEITPDTELHFGRSISYSRINVADDGTVTLTDISGYHDPIPLGKDDLAGIPKDLTKVTETPDGEPFVSSEGVFESENTPALQRRVSDIKNEVANLDSEQVAKIIYDAKYNDQLTGLTNKTGFAEGLDLEIASSAKNGSDLTVVTMDLKKFKGINDQFGHEKGDEALKFVADILKNNIRETDLAVRVSGDEFALILPQTNEQEAQVLMDRIISVLESQKSETGEAALKLVNIDYGIKQWNSETDTVSDFLKNLDVKMYEMKRGTPEVTTTNENQGGFFANLRKTIFGEPTPPPIEAGQVFDPNVEVHNILNSSDPKAALADFKAKYAYQQQGIVDIQTQLADAINKNPEISASELNNLAGSLSQKYGLADWQKNSLDDAIKLYEMRNAQIKAILDKYPNPDDLFEAMYGRKPIGKIQISRGPNSIHVTFYNSEDFKFVANREYLGYTSASPVPGGFFEHLSNLVPGTQGLVVTENKSGLLGSLNIFKDTTYLHEDQHAIFYLLRNSDVISQTTVNAERSALLTSLSDGSFTESKLTAYVQTAQANSDFNIANEALAFFKEGNDTGSIIQKLSVPSSKGGFYHFNEYWQNDLNSIAGTAQDPALAGTIRNAASSQLGQETYISNMQTDLEAFDTLLKKGYTRNEVVTTLQTVPLSGWNNLAERMPEQSLFNRTITYSANRIFTPSTTAILSSPGPYLAFGGGIALDFEVLHLIFPDTFNIQTVQKIINNIRSGRPINTPSINAGSYIIDKKSGLADLYEIAFKLSFS